MANPHNNTDVAHYAEGHEDLGRQNVITELQAQLAKQKHDAEGQIAALQGEVKAAKDERDSYKAGLEQVRGELESAKAALEAATAPQPEASEEAKSDKSGKGSGKKA